MCHMSISELAWRKSRHSGGHSHCVEIAVAAGDGVRLHPVGRQVLARDSKNTPGPVLAVTPAAWQQFTQEIKAGRLGL